MNTRLSLAAATLLATSFAHAARADLAPPPGALIDVAALSSTTTAGYVQFSATFTADQSATAISFVFRNDPYYFGFDDASVTPVGGGVNLLADPGFESGAVGSQTPAGWGNFQQTTGIQAAGQVETGVGDGGVVANSGANYWDDGSVGAYDGLYQTVATTAGQSYTLSFNLWNFESGDAYSQTGVGIDALAYAGDTLPNGAIVTVAAPPTPPAPSLPEPASVSVLGLGLACVGLSRRRSR